MATLSFETGIKTFDINGDPNRVVSFNPSDLNFIHRLYDGYMKLDALQRKYSLQADKAPEATKMMTIAHEAEGSIRPASDFCCNRFLQFFPVRLLQHIFPRLFLEHSFRL